MTFVRLLSRSAFVHSTRTATTTFLRSNTRLFSAAAAVAPSSNHAHTALSNPTASIIYTETDEAPALATYSLYPVIEKVKK